MNHSYIISNQYQIYNNPLSTYLCIGTSLVDLFSISEQLSSRIFDYFIVQFEKLYNPQTCDTKIEFESNLVKYL